jgi:hypothetical protein
VKNIQLSLTSSAICLPASNRSNRFRPLPLPESSPIQTPASLPALNELVLPCGNPAARFHGSQRQAGYNLIGSFGEPKS